MNVLDAIRSRHSYRGKYQPTPVPRSDLETIMQAGLDAPSGCNRQTTSLIAVDDPAVLQRLREVINPPVAETAPAAICVLTRRINAYRDKCFAVQDYSAAIQNMLLAIVELGYQSCWIEGHITDDDRICDKMARILNLPEDRKTASSSASSPSASRKAARPFPRRSRSPSAPGSIPSRSRNPGPSPSYRDLLRTRFRGPKQTRDKSGKL